MEQQACLGPIPKAMVALSYILCQAQIGYARGQGRLKRRAEMGHFHPYARLILISMALFRMAWSFLHFVTLYAAGALVPGSHL